ncbi:MAG: terminase [Clostridiales bacterium]|nr:terminase [Clostridiales bacterium]
MARAPDPRIEEAKAMYLNGIKLVEIASQLNLPEGTVRRWKCTHRWDTERSDKKSERSVRKKGGQPGNRNAVGNDGGAPPGNKNAVTTGEFETLLFDCLDEDEKRLIHAVPADKHQLLLQEIQLLTVREHRMLKRIDDLKKATDDQSEPKYEMKVPLGMTAVSCRGGIEKGEITKLVEYKGILGQIQSVEDALTRVQARKQRAIEALHKFGFDDARLELEIMKVELTAMKMDNQETETADDGFLEALNIEAGSLWGDADGSE